MEATDRPRLAAAALIFGSGRSGTTWVQDAVAEANNLKTVFEPLHPRCVPGARQFANSYVSPDEVNPALADFLGPFLHGRRRNMWTSIRAHPDMLMPGMSELVKWRTVRDTRAYYMKLLRRWWNFRSRADRPLVVKFIRANLMAEWVSKTFDLPAAVVVRHPCAVVSSVIRRMGDDWSAESLSKMLEAYLDQPRIWQEVFDVDIGVLGKLHTVAEVQTAIWCIENSKFLAQGSASPVPVFFYEELLGGSERIWRELSHSLSLPKTPDERLLSKPSQQASRVSGERVDEHKQKTAWRRYLAVEQLRDVENVLNVFGVSAYSVESPMPNVPDENYGSQLVAD